MSVVTFDCALVTRTQAGDEDATTELAAQMRPIAQRYAGRFFSDPARAEDLAQTAMMKAFARVRDVRTPEAFQGWLLRITRNECLNELARQRVAQVPISALEDQGTAIEAPAGGEDDPEEAFVRVQLQSLVRQVITTLPKHYRQTLTMRALEDRTYEEISEELDVPVAVARLWYCRARKRFRQAFVSAMVARRGVPQECQAMGGDIAELIEGTLTREQRDRVQGHLAGCHVCRQTEDELRSTAFRAPARAMLLGLGLLRVPRKVAQNVAQTARTAGWGTRIALGTAGTATALVAGGAPVVVAVHAFSGVVTPAAAQAPAAAAPQGAATASRGGIAGPGHASARKGTTAASGAGAAAAPGVAGTVDGVVTATTGMDIGRTLRLELGGVFLASGTLTGGAPQAVQPVLAILNQVQSGSQPPSSGAGPAPAPASSPSPQPAPSATPQASSGGSPTGQPQPPSGDPTGLPTPPATPLPGL